MSITPLQIVDLMAVGASLNFGFLAFVQFRENLRLPVDTKLRGDVANARNRLAQAKSQNDAILQKSIERHIRKAETLLERSARIKNLIDHADPVLSTICLLCGISCIYFVFLAAFCPNHSLSGWIPAAAILSSIGWSASLIGNILAYTYVSWGLDLASRQS